MAPSRTKKVTTAAAKKSSQRKAVHTRSQTSKRINSAVNGHVEDEPDMHRRSGFASLAGDGNVAVDEAPPANLTSQTDGFVPSAENNGQSHYLQSSRDIAELEKALSVTKGKVAGIVIDVVSTHLS